MNYSLKSNLFALFTLAMISALQSCKNLPTLQGMAIAGDYIDESNKGKIKLNPDGTGIMIINQDKQDVPQFSNPQFNFSELSLKYKVDGDNLIADLYLTPEEWQKYKNSPYYKMALMTGKSPDQIRADIFDKKQGSLSLHKEGDNKLCDAQPNSKKDCLIKQ